VAKKRSTEDISGSTFADLYDVQEELTRKGVKPMGRPKNKIKRNPTTVYLTKEEFMALRRLHLEMGEHLSSINRSQIMGIAIELMLELINMHNQDGRLLEGARSVDVVRRKLKDALLM
jgi:hypothetical protein